MDESTIDCRVCSNAGAIEIQVRILDADAAYVIVARETLCDAHWPLALLNRVKHLGDPGQVVCVPL